MRPGRSFEPHLVINEISLPQSAEWVPQLWGWALIRIQKGICYWSQPGGTQELAHGSALIITGEPRGAFRASQLNEVLMNYFCMDVERLSGLLSLAEQRLLQQAATRKPLTVNVLPPENPIALRFGNLCLNRNGGNVSHRLQLLQLFTDFFEFALKEETCITQVFDGRARLRKLLRQMVASELIEVSLADLAPKLNCSPRHLSRLFREEVGVSFQQKQTELRLSRACQLLTSTDAKVIDVGSASGYQSNSLFSLMFKKHFGMSPGKWRQRHKKIPTGRQRVVRMLTV